MDYLTLLEDHLKTEKEYRLESLKLFQEEREEMARRFLEERQELLRKFSEERQQWLNALASLQAAVQCISCTTDDGNGSTKTSQR